MVEDKTADQPRVFQSTLPVRGATQIDGAAKLLLVKFQSTLPVRGATHALHQRTPKPIYFNPRSPCGERREPPRIHKRWIIISIHAPRAGSDLVLSNFLLRPFGISIHAPRAGSDVKKRHKVAIAKLFQSTPPVRGATLATSKDTKKS